VLTLYTTPLSANGRKTLAVSHHLGLRPAVEIVDVYRGEGRRPEYLALNPLGKVPTLVDGDLVLFESNAILVYLSEAHGGFRLFSRDPRRRAEIARWLFFESSHWQPALALVLAGFVARRLGLAAAPPPAEVRFDDERLAPLLRFVDARLRGRAFLAGDQITLADFSLGAMMMYVRPAGFPFDAYPGIGAWYGRIEALEAWRATAAGPWNSAAR
jgi:glutathione S-transferase